MLIRSMVEELAEQCLSWEQLPGLNQFASAANDSCTIPRNREGLSVWPDKRSQSALVRQNCGHGRRRDRSLGSVVLKPAVQLRIPANPSSDSGRSLPAVPEQAVHRFRSMASSRSEATLVVSLYS